MIAYYDLVHHAFIQNDTRRQQDRIVRWHGIENNDFVALCWALILMCLSGCLFASLMSLPFLWTCQVQTCVVLIFFIFAMQSFARMFRE